MKKILIFLIGISSVFSATLQIDLFYIAIDDPCVGKYQDDRVYFKNEYCEEKEDSVIVHMRGQDISFSLIKKDEYGYFVEHLNEFMKDLFNKDLYLENRLCISLSYSLMEEETTTCANPSDLTINNDYVFRYWDINLKNEAFHSLKVNQKKKT
jgi:hypothetical protein